MDRPVRGLPPLSPEQQGKLDQFHAACSELLDRLIKGYEVDFNRHAVKHGAMPEDRAVFDMARLLAQDVPPNMLAGITAMAIVRGIAKKRGGKG